MTSMRQWVLAQEGASYDAMRSAAAPKDATLTERILFVSDDEQLRVLTCELLAAHGYRRVLGLDNFTALASSQQLASYDVAIVDMSSSYANAVRAFRKIKKSGNTSIVVIGAKTYPSEDTGSVANGDVLLTKPFDPRELLFVIRGMLHGRARAVPQNRALLAAGPIALHLLLNSATVGRREIELTGCETRVLEELLANASSPVSRERLTRHALGREWSPFDRCLDSHINRLRRKIGEDLRGRTPIRSIRGVGYMLLAEWEPPP
jgi:DNA-binding response OmpR family regulator